MPVTRGHPRPRSIFTKPEMRRAVRQHTMPVQLADRTWRHIVTVLQRDPGDKPELVVLQQLQQAAAEYSASCPWLLSARQAGRFIRALPPMPRSERVVAAVAMCVFDVWEAHRYPEFRPLLCYCLNYGSIEFYNSTDLMTTRRELCEFQTRRETNAHPHLVWYLRQLD